MNRRSISKWLTVAGLVASSLIALGALSANAAPAQSSTNDVQRFSDESVVPGASSTLVRTQAGVTMRLSTSGLEPGAAYTAWWVIFNLPGNCSDGVCGEDDVLPPPGNVDAQVSVVRAAGRVLGADGTANFGGQLHVGDTSDALFGPGLLNPFTAEVHLIVRGKGQRIPGMVDDQIGTFGGGCEINSCGDQQFSVHMP